MIKINNLQKSFGSKAALSIDGLEIKNGECVGIVGNNGAGKTTLFKCILDLIKPDQGSVSLDGVVVGESDDWQIHLNAFLDESFLIEFLKPKEYLGFVLKMKKSSLDVDELLASNSSFSNADIDESEKFIRDLSTGTKIRIGVLSLLAGNPNYLLLDEPFAHLDPSSQVRLGRLLKSQKEQGKTILLSSHNLQNIAETCDRIILIENGRVIEDKEVNELSMAELASYFEVN